jgi:hypothetical protein
MHTWPAHADALSDAFNQGATLGRSGNTAARGQISGTTAQATVPNYTTAPPEASYFGSPGLGTLSSAHVSACAGATGQPANFAQQGCNAVDFSQTNPSRRPTYSIGPNDPLLTRAKTITADPQAIAGNLAGTYSGCSVQTVTRPDIFETLLCHQYRTMENTSMRQGPDRHADPDPRLLAGAVPDAGDRGPLPGLYRLPRLRLQLRREQLPDARLHHRQG